VLQLLRFRYSTNVDRVALALAHKGIGDVESVWVDPGDRSPVEAVSGQPLVPVLVDDGRVVADSTAIVEHLERRWPDPPLLPADPARAAEVRIFVDWFNRVWKAPPNLLAGALDAGRSPGEPELRGWAEEIRSHLDRFEALLTGREHLMGDFGAADVAAWPFLRYGLWIDDDDTETFHRVIHEHQATTRERHPNLVAYLERVRDRAEELGVRSG
jgi:glutathione S-transferase